MVYPYTLTRWSYGGHLEHYGIKGQQWNVRRFQNEDGTLTPEGMRRYGVGQGDKRISAREFSRMADNYKQNKSYDDSIRKRIQKEKEEGVDIGNRRRALEQKFLEKGYTKEQAEIKAFKQKRIESVVKVVGAVAVAAAVTYGAIKGRQLIHRYADKTIKSGTALQRISDTPVDDMGRTVFVSPDKGDWVKYRGQYGAQLNERHGQLKFQNALRKFTGQEPLKVNDSIYQVTGTASSNIKVAGERTGKKIFNDLMKNDSAFKKDFDEHVRPMLPSSPKNPTADYELFNRALGTHNNEGLVRARTKFYDALKNKGYGGLIDVNDRRYSGYNSKNPTIMFDFGKHVKNLGLTKLEDVDIRRDFDLANQAIMRDYAKANRSQAVSKILKSTSGRAAAATGAGWIGLQLTKPLSRNEGARYRMLINSYKKEHPNTQLTDDQILDNLLGA